MSFKPRHGGALRTATAIRVKAGGTLRPASSGRIKAGGNVETFWSTATALALNVTPDPLFASSFTGTITTGAATATPTGGTAPYSYLCEIVTFEGNAPTINSSAFASSTFTQVSTGGAGGEINACTFRWTVTDSLGATATDTIQVTFRHLSED